MTAGGLSQYIVGLKVPGTRYASKMSVLAPQFTANKSALYTEVRARLSSLLEGETDLVAMLSTVVCELHHSFTYFHWTGFYRAFGEELVVGPYQGGHGCLRIAFSRGVCGAAASTKLTQRYDNVHNAPDHIACSSSTVSEIVVPVISRSGGLLAVLDVDSNLASAFCDVDQRELEAIAAMLGARWEACG